MAVGQIDGRGCHSDGFNCNPGFSAARWQRDAVEFSVEVDDDVDPRRLRARTRLLDAATKLLSAGGVEAVAIDAVTKASKVWRGPTLYRHFSSSTQLLAATFERLLPQVTPSAGDGIRCENGSLNCLSRQATLFQEAPLHVTALAWGSAGPDTRRRREGMRSSCAADADHRPLSPTVRCPPAKSRRGGKRSDLVVPAGIEPATVRGAPSRLPLWCITGIMNVSDSSSCAH
jgi:hypothetical protein